MKDGDRDRDRDREGQRNVMKVNDDVKRQKRGKKMKR